MVKQTKVVSTVLKFIYSEKATIFFEISTVDLSYVVMVKSTVDISQNFVAFSEYTTFNLRIWQNEISISQQQSYTEI